MSLRLSSSSDSSSNATTTWCLLGPPTAALLYSSVVAWFLPFFQECNYRDTLPSVIPRLTLWGVAYGGAAVLLGASTSNHGHENNKSGSSSSLIAAKVLASLTSTAASIWLCWRTRRNLVEGGPPPFPNKRIVNCNNNPEPRVFIVTGANTGIGKETCQQLLEHDANSVVVMACRSMERAQEARTSILKQLQRRGCASVSESRLPIVQVDLSSLDSVRQAAAHVIREYQNCNVHALINNAGLMRGTMATTKDGMEMVMQANHVGHYLWLRLLLPHLRSITTTTTTSRSSNINDTAPALPRVVIVTSSTYKYAASMDVDDLFCQHGRPYTLFGQYAQSKLANILTVHELQRRYSDITAVAVHPGLVRTDVTRNMPFYLRGPNVLFAGFLALLQKTPSQGAWATLHAALADADELKDADSIYWVNRQPQAVWPCGMDLERARLLWNRTAELVGLPADDNSQQHE